MALILSRSKYNLISNLEYLLVAVYITVIPHFKYPHQTETATSKIRICIHFDPEFLNFQSILDHILETLCKYRNELSERRNFSKS